MKFDDAGGGKRVQFLSVRWDGDKIRGLKWRYVDGTEGMAGGYNTNAWLTEFTFNSQELLKSCKLKDSGYGYGSFRRIEFTTDAGRNFAAGPNGFDHEVDLPVDGALLVGFYGAVNSDGFLNSIGLWVGPPKYDLPAIGTAVNAGYGGNPDAGAKPFDSHSTTSMARYFGVRSDGDKVRGVLMELFDGTTYKAGDYDAVNFALTSYTFDPGESLNTFVVKDSGYGHGSVRRIEFTTSKGASFGAGPNGFDHQVDLAVRGAYLLGFDARVNADNFLNSFGIWVSAPRYVLPPIESPLSTDALGNAGAGRTPFDSHSATSPVRYVGVRWDGDKIRGLMWQYFDGTVQKYGDYDATSYTLTSYTFEPGESLTSFVIKDSAYGHGSVRRIEFTTSKGASFAAGPTGFDHQLDLAVQGSYLLGFSGAINADNFVNSLALWVSKPRYAGLPAIVGSRKTDAIGVGGTGFDTHSDTSPVRYLGVRWDGDKVRGIAWQLFDGSHCKFGDYDAVSYALTSYTFALASR